MEQADTASVTQDVRRQAIVRSREAARPWPDANCGRSTACRPAEPISGERGIDGRSRRWASDEGTSAPLRASYSSPAHTPLHDGRLALAQDDVVASVGIVA